MAPRPTLALAESDARGRVSQMLSKRHQVLDHLGSSYLGRQLCSATPPLTIPRSIKPERAPNLDSMPRGCRMRTVQIYARLPSPGSGDELGQLVAEISPHGRSFHFSLYVEQEGETVAELVEGADSPHAAEIRRLVAARVKRLTLLITRPKPDSRS